MTRHPEHVHHPRPTVTAASKAPPPAVEGDKTIAPVASPAFAQPVFSPDPTQFHVKHLSDTAAYKEIDALNKAHKAASLPFPAPRGLPEPVLTLAAALGPRSADAAAILAAGHIVFHAVGDTGSTRGPETQNEVADKLVSDFEEQEKADVPSFFFHLGDVVYSFGEAKYYYDQFYEPYREYPAPIVALAGNHDGMVAPGATTQSLDAFLRNFCQEKFVITPEAGGLNRTAQIQPGVFYTFEAPFIRIIALYSGTLEDPGVISGGDLGTSQIDFLHAALRRAKAKDPHGALIIAHHHPVYTGGSKHGGSPAMLKQIDDVCKKEGIWPHAVLSAHAHNYQRFTRHHADMEIPYIIAGNGGHGMAKLASKIGPALRVPSPLPSARAADDKVIFESYDDQDYGYLRITASATQLRIEYHPASDGAAAKTPDDTVTIDLASRKIL